MFIAHTTFLHLKRTVKKIWLNKLKRQNYQQLAKHAKLYSDLLKM